MPCSSCWFLRTSVSQNSMPSLPDSRVYRGVLLGLGGIARSGHLPAFQTDPGLAKRLRVVAIVDDAPSAPSSFQGIPLFSRPEELADLGGAPLDFVDICTPTSSHLELSLWGLSQGYHGLGEQREPRRGGHTRGRGAGCGTGGDALPSVPVQPRVAPLEAVARRRSDRPLVP